MPGIPRNKADATARYQFEMGGYHNFVQASLLYQSGTTYSLEATRSFAGETPAFTTFDLSAGTAMSNWTFAAYVDNVFDKRGELGKNSECNDLAAHYCLLNAHVYPVKPMQFGLKFGQRF
jgi:outer membrane receptor protein involved in Fe transport